VAVLLFPVFLYQGTEKNGSDSNWFCAFILTHRFVFGRASREIERKHGPYNRNQGCCRTVIAAQIGVTQSEPRRLCRRLQRLRKVEHPEHE
jgi:hypothetical protein